MNYKPLFYGCSYRPDMLFWKVDGCVIQLGRCGMVYYGPLSVLRRYLYIACVKEMEDIAEKDVQ